MAFAIPCNARVLSLFGNMYEAIEFIFLGLVDIKNVGVIRFEFVYMKITLSLQEGETIVVQIAVFLFFAVAPE